MYFLHKIERLTDKINVIKISKAFECYDICLCPSFYFNAVLIVLLEILLHYQVDIYEGHR